MLSLPYLFCRMCQTSSRGCQRVDLLRWIADLCPAAVSAAELHPSFQGGVGLLSPKGSFGVLNPVSLKISRQLLHLGANRILMLHRKLTPCDPELLVGLSERLLCGSLHLLRRPMGIRVNAIQGSNDMLRCLVFGIIPRRWHQDAARAHYRTAPAVRNSPSSCCSFSHAIDLP